MNSSHTTKSKFLSLVLRHDPGRIGLILAHEGWAEVHEFLARAQAHGVAIGADELDAIVAGSEKQRFAFSSDRRRIRANQGLSVQVELGLPPRVPPDVLYHGTVAKFLPSITVTRPPHRHGRRAPAR